MTNKIILNSIYTNISVLKTFKFMLNDFVARENYKKSAIPSEIQDFKLIKNINNDWKNSKSSLGLYKNNKNEYAFMKMVFFNKKNLQYFKLKQEVNIYRILNKVNYKTGINIPKFIFSSDFNNSSFLMTEYIKGKRLDSYSSESKAKLLIKALESMQTLGKKLNQRERNHLTNRSVISLINLYPFTLILALMRRSNSRGNLIKGLPVVIKNLNIFLKYNKLVLAHRDSHLKNFIVKESRVYVIDLETMGFTVPYYDIAYTLEHEFEDMKFTKAVLDYLNKINKEDVFFERYFRTLMIIVATHALIANDFTRSEINKIENFLDFALNFKFK